MDRLAEAAPQMLNRKTSKVWLVLPLSGIRRDL